MYSFISRIILGGNHKEETINIQADVIRRKFAIIGAFIYGVTLRASAKSDMRWVLKTSDVAKI
jgi:hypothetical protein